MKILLLQLEFAKWKTAKPWSYTLHFGVSKALRDAGHDIFAIPVVPDSDVPFHRSWLGRARELCHGQRFDQVWVWLLHYPYADDTLEWIRQIAPVRVGILGESLFYDEKDYEVVPELIKRPEIIRRQVSCLTHVLSGDEIDVGAIAGWGHCQALWWPGGVPESCILPFRKEVSHPWAVFHGTLYHKREILLTDSRLRKLLRLQTGNGCQNEFQRLFDDIQWNMEKILNSETSLSHGDLGTFLNMLEQVRFGEFTQYMRYLQNWGVIVNLPSYAQFYGGRVFEALAAGRPVVSWKIPNRPCNQSLFVENEEILLFPDDNSSILADHIERLLTDLDFTSKLVSKAQRKIREWYTLEKRVRDVLQWTHAGIQGVPGVTFPGGKSSQYIENQINHHSNIPKDMVMKQEFNGKSHVAPFPLKETTTTSHHQSLSESRTIRNEENAGHGDLLEPKFQQDHFYTDLFVNSGLWSTPYPNEDEQVRWEKIKNFLRMISSQLPKVFGSSMRILDVGCGRGWLTNLLADFGNCEGIDPVEAVVQYGRSLFPDLTLHVGYPDTLLAQPNFQPVDLVVSSEVIEHIPDSKKMEFVQSLKKLVNSDGVIILTTPRKEVWDQWRTVSQPNQPVEDWITEAKLQEVFHACGFQALGCERIYFDLANFKYVPGPAREHKYNAQCIIALYQVWAFGIGKILQYTPEAPGVFSRGEASRPLNKEIPFRHFPSSFSEVAIGVQGEVCDAPLQSPLVSVIVPTYNRRSTLKDALQSIRGQTFTDYEIIVVNDGGVDVNDIVAEFNERNNVSVIQHGKNRGLAAARNSGLGIARGKYIAYLDDDDRFASHHLETLVSFLENSDFRIAYSDAWRIHQREEQGVHVEYYRDMPFSQEFNPDLLLLGNYFPVLCMMHEKKCLDKTGGFDETLTTHEDWDLWIRLSRYYPFAHVKQVTAEFTWRTDGSSMTSKRLDDFLRTKQIIYQKYDEYFRENPDLGPLRDAELRNLHDRIMETHFVCSIIMPVYNKGELTKQCLTKLAEVTEGCSYEVIVVDNASTDETKDFLATLGGDIRIISNPENYGFARACNQGAAVAKGRYLIFLNNDTIPNRGWLQPLVEEVEQHTDVAIVGSKLLYPDQTVQHAGVVISRWFGTPYHFLRGVPSDWPVVNTRKELQAVTAACMLVRKCDFEKLGGFDERYRNGFEDIDLCLKAREQGLKVVYQPRSCLMHLESQTSGRKDCDGQNAQLFKQRWGHQWMEDEDWVGWQNGYATVQKIQNGEFIFLTRPIRDLGSSVTSWKMVAELQKKLLGQPKKPIAELKHQQAIRDLLTRFEQWPNDSGVLEWGGRVAESLGLELAAKGFWSKLLTVAVHPHAHLGLAKLAIKDGDFNEGRRHLDIVNTLYPQEGKGWHLRGILCLQEGSVQEAEKAFKKAIMIAPWATDFIRGLGLAYLSSSKPEQAWNLFEKAVQINQDDPAPLKELMQTGAVLQRWEPLARYLIQFLERNPADCDIRFALAGVQFRAGRIEQAQQQYLTLATLKPDYEGLQDLQVLLESSTIPHGAQSG